MQIKPRQTVAASVSASIRQEETTTTTEDGSTTTTSDEGGPSGRPPAQSDDTDTTTTTTDDPPTTTTTTTSSSSSSSSRSSSSSSSSSTSTDTTTSTTTSSSSVSSASDSDSSATSSEPPASSLPPVSLSTSFQSITADPSSSVTVSVALNDSVSLSTLVTVVDGQSTTIVTPIPTNLSNDNSNSSNLNRNALIAGTTAAGVLILALALAVVFIYRRARKRRITFMEALIKGRREGKAAGSIGLLDGEFDDDDDLSHGMRYRDTPTSTAAPPSLFRPRANDSGSLFHERVWPPPSNESRFVDPIKEAGHGINLSTIVDDVMGPGGINSPQHSRPVSTATADSSTGLVAAAGTVHGAEPSTDSDRVRFDSTTSTNYGSLYNDPFRDTSREESAPPSVYYDRHGKEHSSTSSLAQTSIASHTSQAVNPIPLSPSAMSISSAAIADANNPTGPRSLLGLPAGAAPPKKPSPLATTVVSAAPLSSSASKAASLSSGARPTSPTNWIQRSPKKHVKHMSADSAERSSLDFPR